MGEHETPAYLKRSGILLALGALTSTMLLDSGSVSAGDPVDSPVAAAISECIADEIPVVFGQVWDDEDGDDRLLEDIGLAGVTVDLDIEGFEPAVTDDDGFWAYCLFDEANWTTQATVTVTTPDSFRFVGEGVGAEDEDSDVFGQAIRLTSPLPPPSPGRTPQFSVNTALSAEVSQFEVVNEFAIRIDAGLTRRPLVQFESVEFGECDTEGNRSVRFLSQLAPADADGVTVQWYLDGQPLGQPGPIGTFIDAVPADGQIHAIELRVLTPAGATGDSEQIEIPSCGTFDAGTVEPARVLDTRSNGRTTDGMSQGVGRLDGGSSIEVDIAGRAGAPDGAVAAIINLTAINPSAKGFATAYPCTDQVPNASTINYAAGTNIANSTTVKLSDIGAVCLFTAAEADFAIDLVGFVPADSEFVTVNPTRLLDTRPNGETTDGQARGPRRPRATILDIDISGRGPIPDDAESVVVNLTAVNASDRGFATLYPCTENAPNASTVNYDVGANIANSLVVKLSDTGTICLFTSESADYILDVAGFVRAGSDVGTVEPLRLLDTRPNGTTFDGKFQRIGQRAAGTRFEIEIADPGTAEAAILNLTAINPAASGYATLFPCTDDVPNASALNYTSGSNIANAVTVKLSDAGTVCMFTSAAADFALDAVGYLGSQERDEDDDDKRKVRGRIVGGQD